MPKNDRRLVSAGFLLIGLATLAAAAAGLPLYGDGALYFLEIVLRGAPLVPNERYSAVLPQLPVVAATAVTHQVELLRHVFSLGYGFLPYLSLSACWVIARGTTPALILYPTLFLVADQINFSSVSELLMGLYLGWPFLFLAVLRPGARTTLAAGLALAGGLFLLHPLASVLLIAFGFVALLIRKRSDAVARPWGLLSAVFLTLGLLRLYLSVVGANPYERSHLSQDAAVGYLLPDSAAQGLFLTFTLLLGVVLAVRRGQARGDDAAGNAVAAPGGTAASPSSSTVRRSPVPARVFWLSAGLVLLSGLLVAAQIWVGQGIKLKSAVVFPLAVILMVLALFDADKSRSGGPERSWTWCFLLLAVTITAISLSKTAAWSRALDELAAAMDESAQACVRFGPNHPPVLQSPHMSILDNWTAPMNALVFRAGKPVRLLLPGNGCRELEETGIAYLTPWFGRPLPLLQRHFGYRSAE